MRTLCVGALLLLLAAGLAAQAPSEAVKSLIDTENAFAAMAGKKGIKTAFLAFMVKEAVVLNPEPVPALPYYEKRKKEGDLLYWVPEFAQVSGNLGWTTGPWEYRAQIMQEQPVATGHFVTLWRRQADGSWKWVVDGGVSHPLNGGVRPVAVEPLLNIVPEAADGERERARKALFSLERGFSGGAGKTWSDLPHSEQRHMRIYREGSRVIRNGASAFTALKAARGEVVLSPTDGGVASTADLAYTYGIGTFRSEEGKAPPEQFGYLHIWERQKDGSWKIVVDLTNPIPPKK